MKCNIHTDMNIIWLLCQLMFLLISLDASLIGSNYMEVKSCLSTAGVFDATITNFNVRTKVECASKCSRHVQCVAYEISREEPYTCILHSRTFQAQRCSVYIENDYRKFNDRDSCLNSGLHDPVSGCTCMESYIGDNCEHFVEDCTDAFSSGHYSGNIVLLIQPKNSPDPFLVYCKMAWGGRTFLMNRNPGLVSFNRPWAEYKAGFGDLEKEFWLGLDKMHQLTTSKAYLLTVQIYTKIPGYLFRQHYYSDFEIDNEAGGYAYTFGSNGAQPAPNNLLDCLVPAKGKKFTTTDVDNDDVAGSNCASVHEGGWWFTGCGECNPTGPMIKPTDGYLLDIPNEIFWKPGLSNYSINKIAFFLTIATN